MNTDSKLIIMTAVYREQVRYLLDNYVATDEVTADDWMKIFDQEAIRYVESLEPVPVEFDVISENDDG